jgi:hypothetical protein
VFAEAPGDAGESRVPALEIKRVIKQESQPAALSAPAGSPADYPSRASTAFQSMFLKNASR